MSKENLHLPKTAFSMKADLPKKEPEILKKWEEEKLFNQIRESSKGKEKFILHDGPPYANGHIHMGTALNKILKDMITRFHQMNGKDSVYVPGWDCHGLPIEWKIEEEYKKNLEEKSKKLASKYLQENQELEKKLEEELSGEKVEEIINKFVLASNRSVEAGFSCIELHLAHGYLAHEFCSPISNTREDMYGGNFENRTIFGVEIAKRIRKEIGEEIPLIARISVTEYHDEGWDVNSSIEFSKKLKDSGVDMIDCSSGGNYSDQKIDLKPGYQVPLSKSIKENVEILTGAVGLITEKDQAEEVLDNHEADVIFLGRELLRNPYWTLYASGEINEWPLQYQRSFEGSKKINYIRED